MGTHRQAILALKEGLLLLRLTEYRLRRRCLAACCCAALCMLICIGLLLFLLPLPPFLRPGSALRCRRRRVCIQAAGTCHCCPHYAAPSPAGRPLHPSRCADHSNNLLKDVW